MISVLRLVSGAALILGLTGAALCQSPVRGNEEQSRLMAYDELFDRVSWFEGKANQLRAQGRPTSLGSSVRFDYALTSDEYSRLVDVAADWRTKFDAINAKAKPLLGSGLTTNTSPELSRLLQERLQVTRNHISQLQSVLGGPARLAAMEALVMRRRASRERTSQSANVASQQQ